MLDRKHLKNLENWWQKGMQRKPLLIRGARQVGKTTLVRMLSERLNLQLVEINLEKPWGFTSTFKDFNPHRTIEAIEFELNIDIDPQKSIIFFDEAQACPSVLGLLRYFYEEAQDYRVIATGSLLEFVLAEPTFSIPVGRIELYHIGPMNFLEFLSALDEEKAITRIKGYCLGDDIPDTVHDKLNHLVRIYSIIGGMPEAVACYAQTRSFKAVEKVKSEIIETFRLDFNKYNNRGNPHLLTKVFDSLPRLMGKKLVFSKIHPEYRSKELSKTFDQLCMAGITSKIFNCHANGVPMAAEKMERFFKVLLLDTGLLLTQLKLIPTDIDRIPELNLVNQGTLAEQFIGQHLYRLQPYFQAPELYYWAREKKSASAEVDYIIADNNQRIVPIEVKAGSTGKLRSLQIMVMEKSLSRAIRFSSAPPSVLRENRITAKGPVAFTLISLPHYLVGEISRLLTDGEIREKE
ncbi:AAA family ATPase [bacterium]|nr:AAA family ATPase [bacterium]